MSVVLAVAPHPDDETLGCGGALLRHVAEGDSVHWLVVTDMLEAQGYQPEAIRERSSQIEAVSKAYEVTGLHRMGLPTTDLDAMPLSDLVAAASEVFDEIEPDTVYLPHPGDAHSDHRRVFEMCAAATKWFRHGSVHQVFAYETLSETGFQLDPDRPAFRPTAYVDITAHLERKVEILGHYADEMAPFPFPRSAEAVRALAVLRGAESGYRAAEAFSVLRQRR